jgi:hypothetical protein
MSRRQRRAVADPQQRASIPDALRRTINSCLSEYVNIPHPSETWHFCEADITESAHHQLIADNGVHEVGRTGERRKWSTDPDVYAEIQRLAEESPLLDCGHKAFRTVDLDDAAPYSCLRDECDARYTRAEITEVMR